MAILRPRPRHRQVHTQHMPTIRQPVRCDTAMEACDTQGTARRGARVRLRQGGLGYDTAGDLGHDTARLPTIRPGVCTPRRACVRLGVPS